MKFPIKEVFDYETMIRYCSDNLGWDIDIDSFVNIEDITYGFEAEDIGLKHEEFLHIDSLYQLRPLVDNQSWGIFFIEFNRNRFEISALRKVLSGLVPKRRNSEHAMWDKKNLLFICFWGEGSNRTIGIANFEDNEQGLPRIKTIYCSPALEDSSHLSYFESKLNNLVWPKTPTDIKNWEIQWSGAFEVTYKQVIRDSMMLTTELASMAKRVQKQILDILKVEIANGYVHLLYEKFKQALIHDMTTVQFADMYAQTMVYGLFSARCMESTLGRFDPISSIESIPNTNPLLKKFMKDSFSHTNSKISFDELELYDIVKLLNNTDTDIILKDFNRQTGGGKEDPVIYFYEGFLDEYESEQKKRRGVYYTPQPIVNFIVRAVDDLLKTEFNISEGLADVSTKSIMEIVEGKKKRRKSVVPAIQILDPATGTGTFLRQTILKIYSNFKKKNIGKSNAIISELWSQYVPKNLLPRLNGFEIMMAPYAVAHMKLAMVLKETGYDFQGNERANIFLTNSLEKAGNTGLLMTFWDDPLTAEATESNRVKNNQGINVVLGNPPYSISSTNKSEWIQKLIQDYKTGLNERKLNLDDDYIKFIRLGQHYIDRNGEGILAYISNNSFIDGITHRQMRKNLANSFNKIYILDLHGNSSKKEKAFDGSKDENVFDIQQGVSINIFVKSKDEKKEFKHFELLGKRSLKYDFLNENSISSIAWSDVTIDSENCFFNVKKFNQSSKYSNYFGLSDLFPIYNSGIQTKRDALTICFSKEVAKQTLLDLVTLPKANIISKFSLPEDGRDWKLDYAINDIKKNDVIVFREQYRPFDFRYSFYTGNSKGILAYPRSIVSKHMINRDNLAFCLMRQFFQDTGFSHVLATDVMVDERTMYSNRGGTYIFPLYLYEKKDLHNPNSSEYVRTPNLKKEIIDQIAKNLRLNFSCEKEVSPLSFSPIDVFDYIYVVLHSPAYRVKYLENLRIDYPRIPYPTDAKTFWSLVSIGSELRQIHLFKSSRTNHPIVTFSVIGTNEVVNPRYADGKIWINKEQYFGNISHSAWVFYIGGYQPAQKWLKDRKGYVLNTEDIEHYINIITIAEETNKIVLDIDKLLDI
jgi:predicted helicase